MSDKPPNKDDKEDSIAGLSAEQFVTRDDSLAELLLNRGIQVRDFIVLSFLSDQGTMSVSQLSRILGIEPAHVLEGARRLSGAGLVIRDPHARDSGEETTVSLTGRGQDIATRISDQLQEQH